jgi:hypothetical protein
MSTAQSMTNAEYYAFEVDSMRLTQISHLLNELGMPTIPLIFSGSQSPIASIKNGIYCGTAVTHIVTKYHLAADMPRDREIDLNCVPTAEIIADCFTKPQQKPAFLKQCAEIGMIGNRLSRLRNDCRNRIGTGKGIENVVGK